MITNSNIVAIIATMAIAAAPMAILIFDDIV